MYYNNIYINIILYYYKEYCKTLILLRLGQNFLSGSNEDFCGRSNEASNTMK